MKKELLIESWLEPAEDDHITVVDLYEASLQAIDYIEEIEEQRDELLESLKMMLEMSEMGGFGKAYAEDVARAAIAKAKGEE